MYINTNHLFKNIHYPERYLTGNLFKTSGVILGVILSFLLFFKPFGVNMPEQRWNYFFICVIHALAPAIMLYCYFAILNCLRDLSGLKDWKLSWEYVHLGMVFLLTGMANFLMRDIIYYNRNNWSWFYLKEELINSFVAGTLFYFMFRLASFYFQSKKGDPFVLQFTPLSVEPEKFAPPLKLFIKTKVKQDDFSLILSDLLFARAEGNYLELTCYQNGQIKNELKRISLTAFNTQVSQHPGFFRCHRAYLVNMRWIENVSGNAQGYLLGFNYTQTKVPVSRAQLEDFNNLYKQLQENTII